MIKMLKKYLAARRERLKKDAIYQIRLRLTREICEDLHKRGLTVCATIQYDNERFAKIWSKYSEITEHKMITTGSSWIYLPEMDVLVLYFKDGVDVQGDPAPAS